MEYRSPTSPVATSRRWCWPGGWPATRAADLDEPTRGVDVGASPRSTRSSTSLPPPASPSDGVLRAAEVLGWRTIVMKNRITGELPRRGDRGRHPRAGHGANCPTSRGLQTDLEQPVTIRHVKRRRTPPEPEAIRPVRTPQRQTLQRRTPGDEPRGRAGTEGRRTGLAGVRRAHQRRPGAEPDPARGIVLIARSSPPASRPS